MSSMQAAEEKAARMPRRKLDPIPGDYGKPVIGDTFQFLRDFANHKNHRRIMQQAFKKNALAGYVERMNPHIAEDKGHHFQWIPFGGGHHQCLGINFAEMQSQQVPLVPRG